MTTTYSVTITCDDRPGGGFACTASYTTRLTHPGESPSVALAAARLMGWTRTADPMGGYADRCPACSQLAACKAQASSEGHAYSCETPAFNGDASDARTGETWRCSCGKTWIADREQEIWYPQGHPHPCGKVPRDADRTKPWYCHCGQGWEYSLDVKAWTRTGHEE